MLKILLLFISLCSAPEFVLMDGWLSQYAKGPTDATIAYRQEVGELPQDLSNYDGVVAVENCDHIGRDAYLYTDNWHRVIVFDCLGRDVKNNWMQENSIIAEMGYYLTKDLGLVGQGGVRARLLIVTEPQQP